MLARSASVIPSNALLQYATASFNAARTSRTPWSAAVPSANPSNSVTRRTEAVTRSARAGIAPTTAEAARVADPVAEKLALG